MGKIMSFSEPGPAKPKKLLILTSSGGGGLLQAAVAKEQEALLADPDVVIVRCDVLKDWMGKRFGAFCAGFWNGAQMKGDVKMQRFIQISHLLFAEFLFWPQIFFWALYTLFKEDVDRIIDTQPLGTPAILKAIRIFNRKKSKKLHLEKVLVDLPTKKATHFFRPIKRLSKRDRKHLKLTTIAPLLDKGETEEEFWEKTCNLPRDQIYYEEPYVRQSFCKHKGKPRPAGTTVIPLVYKNPSELHLLQKAFHKGAVQARISNFEVEVLIGSEDRVMTVLLGSQPASDATFAYVKKFIQLAKENSSSNPLTHLFVFAADHEPKAQSLFRKIAEHVARIKDYPKYFSVIPFSFQADSAIAPLFHRSDLTITRSGGQTAMELMCVSTGEIWIHSEAKKEADQELSIEQLLRGIPGWEAENAVYLQRFRGASLVTPETVLPLARKYFQSSTAQISPLRALQSTG